MTKAVKRTRKLLADALIQLLYIEKRNFESLTVNEICEKALIHRTTFYGHFEDKYELFKYVYRSLTAQRLNFSLEVRLLQPFSVSEKLKQTELLRLALLYQQQSTQMLTLIQQLVREAVANDLRELSQQRSLKLPEDLLVTFLSSTLISLDFYWTNEAPNYQAEQLDALYQLLVQPHIQLL